MVTPSKGLLWQLVIGNLGNGYTKLTAMICWSDHQTTASQCAQFPMLKATFIETATLYIYKWVDGDCITQRDYAMARLKPRSKDLTLTIRPDMSTLLSHCCYHQGVDPDGQLGKG